MKAHGRVRKICGVSDDSLTAKKLNTAVSTGRQDQQRWYTHVIESNSDAWTNEEANSKKLQRRQGWWIELWENRPHHTGFGWQFRETHWNAYAIEWRQIQTMGRQWVCFQIHLSLTYWNTKLASWCAGTVWANTITRTYTTQARTQHISKLLASAQWQWASKRTQISGY